MNEEELCELICIDFEHLIKTNPAKAKEKYPIMFVYWRLGEFAKKGELTIARGQK